MKSTKFTLFTLLFSAVFTITTFAQTVKKTVPAPKKPSVTQKTYTIPAAPAAVYVPVVQNMTESDSLAYAIGVNIGQSFKSQGLDKVNLDMVKKGMADMVNNSSLAIAPEACGGVIQKYMTKASESKNKGVREAGDKFIAENKVKPGVITLPSGLQYSIMKEGTGPKPLATDQVKVHYHGTLPNGEVFDSSVDRGEPATFGVTQVIQGWVEALQLMPVGSKWKLVIPYSLGYGERGAGGKIGPYSPLVFEVELIEIVKK